jgi:5'-deoxynucleotidase YfbR-like HD superfamily hydrolase
MSEEKINLQNSIDNIFKALQVLNNANHLKRAVPNLFAGIPNHYIESFADRSYKATYLTLVFANLVDGVDQEKLLKFAIMHDWGEIVVGNAPTSSPSFQSYFNTDIRVVYKIAEVKALSQINSDLGLEYPTLNDKERSLYDFCITLEVICQLINFRSMGLNHKWIDKIFNVYINFLKEFDFPFADSVINHILDIYKNNSLENSYLTKVAYPEIDSNDSVKNIFKALQVLNNFQYIKRSGANLGAGIPSFQLESLSEHSYRVTYLCLVFGEFFKNINKENLIKYNLTHDWGEVVLNDIPTSGKSFRSYFDDDIRVIYKVAERKVLDALLSDLGLEIPEINEEEKQLYNFCDTLELVLELLDLRQQGFTHGWIEKMFEVQTQLLCGYNFDFVDAVVQNLQKIFNDKAMDNEYLTKASK